MRRYEKSQAHQDAEVDFFEALVTLREMGTHSLRIHVRGNLLKPQYKGPEGRKAFLSHVCDVTEDKAQEKFTIMLNDAIREIIGNYTQEIEPLFLGSTSHVGVAFNFLFNMQVLEHACFEMGFNEEKDFQCKFFWGGYDLLAEYHLAPSGPRTMLDIKGAANTIIATISAGIQNHYHSHQTTLTEIEIKEK